MSSGNLNAITSLDNADMCYPDCSVSAKNKTREDQIHPDLSISSRLLGFLKLLQSLYFSHKKDKRVDCLSLPQQESVLLQQCFMAAD